jgi:hypothetical protein
VSTGKQGLGIEAQRATVENYLNGGNWRVSAEFIEVESGGNNDRPALKRALAKARALRCPVIVAKIDRLSRNQRFLMELVDSGQDIRLSASACPAALARVALLEVVVSNETNLLLKQLTRSKASLARITSVTD